MILHKAHQGKKTSASLDDELFEYVVAYFNGNPQKAREALSQVLQEGMEQQRPLSAYLRSTVLQWIVKTELVEWRDMSQYMRGRPKTRTYADHVITEEEIGMIAQQVRDRLPQ